MLGILFGVYFGAMILLNIPIIQRKITDFVTHELSRGLDTKISIGQIDMGLLNRIIINDVTIADKQGEEMLKVTRLSAKFDILPLMRHKLSISTVQLFGFSIRLNRETPDSKLNYQFILDKLAAKDSSQSGTLDLRINSILIRRGKLSYDVLSAPQTPHSFNIQHLKLSDIIANISLKALQADSINAYVKRFSVKEQSGFELRKLSLKVLANDKKMDIRNFSIHLPHSRMATDKMVLRYDSLAAFNHFTDQVQFLFKLSPNSYVSPADLSAFVPGLQTFKDQMNLHVEATGSLNDLTCSTLKLSVNQDLELQGKVTLNNFLDKYPASVKGTLSRFHLSQKGITFLLQNFSHESDPSPILQRLEYLSFNGAISGYFTDLKAHGLLQTNLGNIQSNLQFHSGQSAKNTFSGTIETTDFQLGKLLDDSHLQNVSLNLKVEGKQLLSRYPSITMNGEVSAIQYNNYRYKNILLDGTYNKKSFDGKIEMNDANGYVFVNGSFDLSKQIPSFNLQAQFNQLQLDKLHLVNQPDTELSLSVRADFKGKTVDDLIGEIQVDSVLYRTEGKEFHTRQFNVSATSDGTNKHLNIYSDFIKAQVDGSYSYRTMPMCIANLISQYIPSWIKPSPRKQEVKTNNNFSFDIHLFNTDLLANLFHIPVEIHTHSTLKGYWNDHTQRINIEGYFPHVKYGKNTLESVVLRCENPTNQLHGYLRFNNIKEDESINVSLEALAADDQLTSHLNWGNTAKVTYSGKLSTVTKFSRDEEKNNALKTTVNIQPTHIILNDSVWQVYPSQVVVENGEVEFKDFCFRHQDQHLKIDGKVSESLSDTIKADLKGIDIEYVFAIVNLTESIDFKGAATGEAYICQTLKNPIMRTKLFVKDFTFNDGLVGDMNINGEWNEKEKGIALNAHIEDKEKATTDVTGYIYPLKPNDGLDLHIHANNTNAKFLEFYLSPIFSDLQVRALGDIRLYGPFSDLNLSGKALAKASMKVNLLNTTFTINDSIQLSPTEMRFNDIMIKDPEGHTGMVNGSLYHEHFRNMKYDFNIQMNNMLAMNTSSSPDIPFYGTVYASGNAHLAGDGDGLNANVAVTTNRNTNFVYTMAQTTATTTNQFIRFFDKTPRRTQPEQSAQTFISPKEDEEETDIRLNVQVEATPEANFKIIMDPVAGDYITAKGNGSIRTEFYNKGDVRMFGNFNITQGVYKFSLQEVIRKDFNIQNGSSISFNGDPLQANLNVRTIYTVNSASLNDLGPEVADLVEQTNVKVNCLMNLSGSLQKPNLALDIELPNEQDEVQSMIRNYINTDEQMNMQILYLLSLGKFYTADNTNGQNSNMVTSVLSSTLSGQLNNMISQITKDNRWNIGTNLSTGNKGWTDVEFESMLSGQLLNNRLLINGSFGYKENPLTTNNFVGDFDVQWLLNRSGEWVFKAYNETNDRYYTRSSLTTQGFGLVYKKDFNKINEFFFWQKWFQPRKKEKPTADNDSITPPISKEKREKQ